MTETIVVAVLSLAGTLIGTYLANRKSAALIAYRLEQLEKIRQSAMRLLSDRLEQLEQKVAKHNGLVERTYHLEEEAAVFEEKLKVANHRIDDLEHGT